MVTLNWCKKQKKGINLIEPNNNLAQEYIQSAEETLNSLKEINESRIWLAAKKYYFRYFLAYSVLMKIGIKCEIHECTIKICTVLEKEKILPDKFAEFLEADKELRIDNQYYLKNLPVEININELTEQFLIIKNVASTLSFDRIKLIREMLKCSQ